jgi:DNA-binding transcriptional ArsR family regulator
MDAATKPSRTLPAEEHLDLAVEVLRMLADATRVRLLWVLSQEELAVNELAERVARSPAGVSQHLAKLRLARLVRSRRAGTQVFYRVANTHVAQLVRDAVLHAEHAAGGIPDHHRAEPPTTRRRAREVTPS